MRSTLLVASLVLAMAGTAAAQPGATPPPPAPLPSTPQPDSSSPPSSTPLPVQPPGATPPPPAPLPSTPQPDSSSPPSSTPPPVQPPGATPPVQPPGAPPPSSSTSPTQPPDGPLSESTALLLSLGGTAGSWTLLLAGGNGDVAAVGLLGTLLAPSFGHWYAHSFATRGLGLRAAGAAGFVFVLSRVAQCEDECSASPVLEGVALVSLGLYIAGTLDDVFTAPGEARGYNQRFHNLSLVPMIRRDTGGVMLTGRF